MVELVVGADDLKHRTGDQITGFEDAVGAGLGDEIAFGVGDVLGQLAGGQFRTLQGNLHHLLAHGIRNAVPESA